MSFDLGDYVDVASRIAEFEAKHPDGSLRPLNPDKPFEVVTIGDRTFIAVVIAAYRTPDDPAPGVGMAWEPFPGLTPYTKNSELQNAETSAQGRAIVAALASSSKKASHEEVRNRRAEQDQPAADAGTHEAIRSIVANLTEPQAKVLAAWWKQQHLPSIKSGDVLTQAQAEAVLNHLDSLEEAA